MPKHVAVSVAAVLLLTAGGVWGATRGDAESQPVKTVALDRGDIAVTVGGIGRVSTLTSAARFSVASDSTTTSTGGSSSADRTEAVFATLTGHVDKLLVGVGDTVKAGQPIARITDDGTMRAAVIQADNDLTAARIDLAQKRVQDPARGVPPTAAELARNRVALAAAKQRLARLQSPLPSDRATLQVELDRARAELAAERASGSARPDALSAAELAVETATQQLARLTGSPDPAELAAAQLEVARAQLDQEQLLRPPTAPTPSQVAAADAAVAAAQEKLAAAQVGGIAADIALAQSELARARADREALTAASAAPSAAARAAAQLAVDAAQKKLDALLRPPAAAVSAARAELSRLKAELATARDTSSTSRLAAATSAVTAAKRRLGQLLDPATEVVTSARSDVAGAAADLAVLRQRGAPASETDLAIAGLRVNLARQQLLLAREMAGRSTVLAPASGTVTSVLAAVGSAVDPSTPLVRVQDLDSLVVSVNLTEFDVSRTRVGATARVGVDALGGRPYSGTVRDVALTGGDSGGVVTFPVIVSLEDADELRPGMSVSVRVVVASREDVVRLPLDAMEDRTGRRAVVSIRTEGGEIRKREVELGLIGRTHAEVRSGLAEGAKVVIPGGDEA